MDTSNNAYSSRMHPICLHNLYKEQNKYALEYRECF